MIMHNLAANVQAFSESIFNSINNIMNYNPLEFDDLIRDVSLSVINDIAPEESEMFDEAYSVTVSAGEKSDDMLGFGVDALSYLATPAVVGMVSSVAGFLFSELVKSLKDESSVIIKAKIKKLFKKDKTDEDKADEKVVLPAFTKEQFAALKLIAVDSAKKSGADEQLAEKMALTLIGSMNLPQT